MAAARTNDGFDARVLVALSGAAMRTADIQLDRRQWLFWSDFLTCQVSLWAVSCFDHRRGLLMTEFGHFYFLLFTRVHAAYCWSVEWDSCGDLPRAGSFAANIP